MRINSWPQVIKILTIKRSISYPQDITPDNKDLNSWPSRDQTTTPQTSISWPQKVKPVTPIDQTPTIKTSISWPQKIKLLPLRDQTPYHKRSNFWPLKIKSYRKGIKLLPQEIKTLTLKGSNSYPSRDQNPDPKRSNSLPLKIKLLTLRDQILPQRHQTFTLNRSNSRPSRQSPGPQCRHWPDWEEDFHQAPSSSWCSYWWCSSTTWPRPPHSLTSWLTAGSGTAPTRSLSLIAWGPGRRGPLFYWRGRRRGGRRTWPKRKLSTVSRVTRFPCLDLCWTRGLTGETFHFIVYRLVSLGGIPVHERFSKAES